jgi:hypothetical protein
MEVAVKDSENNNFIFLITVEDRPYDPDLANEMERVKGFWKRRYIAFLEEVVAISSLLHSLSFSGHG